MKFYEMEEGKVYKVKDGVSNYRINEGNVEGSAKFEEGWAKTKITHRALYELDFEESKEKKIGWERVIKDKDYFNINGAGEIHAYKELRGIDNSFYNNCNYFSTKEKAEQINNMNLLQRKMQKFADEHNEYKINWEDSDQKKYCIYYNYYSKDYSIKVVTFVEAVGVTYFTSEKIAQRCIAEVLSPLQNKDN